MKICGLERALSGSMCSSLGQSRRSVAELAEQCFIDRRRRDKAWQVRVGSQESEIVFQDIMPSDACFVSKQAALSIPSRTIPWTSQMLLSWWMRLCNDALVDSWRWTLSKAHWFILSVILTVSLVTGIIAVWSLILAVHDCWNYYIWDHDQGHQCIARSLMHGIEKRSLSEALGETGCNYCSSQIRFQTNTLCTKFSSQGSTVAYKSSRSALCCLSMVSKSSQSCTGKKIAISRSVETGDRGLIALEDINPNEILISVPFADTVHVTEVSF